MASLQDRLQAVFGSLSSASDSAAAWKPAQQQVFRSGAIDDAGNSSDEEYEERQRRETVPGLAQALVDEDEPDAEGFRPSTAFCRALDAEEEYNEIDEMATGMIARRHGGDALPPRHMQVPDDNPFEEHIRRQEAAAAGAAGQHAAGMEVEEPHGAGAAAGAGELPSADLQQQGSGLRSALSSPRAGGEARQRKQVRFEGVAAPWVPPARRPGYQPRCTELPPGEGATEGPPAQQERAAQQGRPGSLSAVPDHVKNPHKYTCYVLDEALVVGGGVGQLSRSSQQADVPPTAAAGSGSPPKQHGQEAELERWAGAVGKGAVQFRPRHRVEGDAAEPAGGGKAGGTAAASRQQGPQLAFDDSADVEADEGAAGGGDAAMQVDASVAAVPQPQARGSKRHYRSSRAAAADDE